MAFVIKIPARTKLSMTYTDEDSDVITMNSDGDFHDALFQQKLNPLRVTVKVGGKSGSSSTSTPSKPSAAAEKIKADTAKADEAARARIEAETLAQIRLANEAAEAQAAIDRSIVRNRIAMQGAYGAYLVS